MNPLIRQRALPIGTALSGVTAKIEAHLARVVEIEAEIVDLSVKEAEAVKAALDAPVRGGAINPYATGQDAFRAREKARKLKVEKSDVEFILSELYRRRVVLEGDVAAEQLAAKVSEFPEVNERLEAAYASAAELVRRFFEDAWPGVQDAWVAYGSLRAGVERESLLSQASMSDPKAGGRWEQAATALYGPMPATAAELLEVLIVAALNSDGSADRYRIRSKVTDLMPDLTDSNTTLEIPVVVDKVKPGEVVPWVAKLAADRKRRVASLEPAPAFVMNAGDLAAIEANEAERKRQADAAFAFRSTGGFALPSGEAQAGVYPEHQLEAAIRRSEHTDDEFSLAERAELLAAQRAADLVE